MKKKITYNLTLQNTASATGFYKPVPQAIAPWTEGIAYLQTHPMDTFMHAHLLDLLQKMAPSDFESILDENLSPPLEALLHEAVLLYEVFAGLRKRLDTARIHTWREETPLLYIRSSQMPDSVLHGKWMRLFRSNVHGLHPLPPPESVGLEWPVRESDVTADPPVTPSPPRVMETAGPFHQRKNGDSEQTARRVLTLLDQLAIPDGEEMRHLASLSPIGLLQKWRIHTSVRCGRHHFTLSGTQTAYGRGLSAWDARVGYAMEIAERRSSFADIEDDVILGLVHPSPLVKGSWKTLTAEGRPLLDPNDLRIEVPYEDAPLYWIEATASPPGGDHPIWVPVQTVFLFSNLDEIGLFSGFGSTGLAAGTTPDQARLSAILECVERDADAVTPFDPSRCFRIIADDPDISALLQDYRHRGIHIGCQEITTENGIPAFRCFVMGMNGYVARGTGAHLDAQKAFMAALTETPYPYPYGPPSVPITESFPVKRFESLNNHSTGNATSDLAIVASQLAHCGYTPIYVDLTREDLSIPVFRAMVPGLEIINDFDFLSRVSPRLFSNYLRVNHSGDSG